MSRDGKTHDQIDHILIWERLAVNKQRSHISYGDVHLKKFYEREGKEQYHVEVSNILAALESLDAEININSDWETVRENIKISAKERLGYCELRMHKPWFNEGCSKLFE
jgi:hypothetical protein